MSLITDACPSSARRATRPAPQAVDPLARPREPPPPDAAPAARPQRGRRSAGARLVLARLARPPAPPGQGELRLERRHRDARATGPALQVQIACGRGGNGGEGEQALAECGGVQRLLLPGADALTAAVGPEDVVDEPHRAPR